MDFPEKARAMVKEMDRFYFEKKKGEDVIREELVTTKAEKWAQSFLRGRPTLPMHQLRRFYNEVKSLEARVEAGGFDKTRPLIKMLQSKVAHACPKSSAGRKVPQEFRNFVDECVKAIDKPEDFGAFVLVFEAVVGYYYGEGGR